MGEDCRETKARRQQPHIKMLWLSRISSNHVSILIYCCDRPRLSQDDGQEGIKGTCKSGYTVFMLYLTHEEIILNGNRASN